MFSLFLRCTDLRLIFMGGKQTSAT